MSRFKLSNNLIMPTATDRRYYYGPRIVTSTGGSYFLGCCGMAGIESFNYVTKEYGFDLSDWATKADFLALLYLTLYNQGTVVYALTDKQLENQLHRALLEVGSTEVAVFPNLYHGPNMMHLFKVNIRNVAGRYCDKHGKAYAEPPKDDAEVIPEQTTAGIAGVFANIHTL